MRGEVRVMLSIKRIPTHEIVVAAVCLMMFAGYVHYHLENLENDLAFSRSFSMSLTSTH